ncbi:hypothetical protein ACHAXT_004415 [Thalassiosira profunda]
MSARSSSSPQRARNDDAIECQNESPLRRGAPVATSTSLRRNCLLVVIGAMLFCSMTLSLLLGHYHHNADELLHVASSTLHVRLQDFAGEGRGGKPQPSGSGKPRETSSGPNHERAVFESIIQRVRWTETQCNNLPSDQRHTVKKDFKVATDLPMLPEGGVASALERWMKDNPPSSPEANDDYPTCYLPPAKSCDVSTYTLVIMSHTTERLKTFMDPLGPMIDSWPGLTEIIIVWNSPRETLTTVVDAGESKGQEYEYAKRLLEWDGDAAHPLRIFFSLTNGLSNNLLNRYHPSLKPKNEAVMYFDDDGPFWSKEAMVFGGLELWKHNSNVQVGGFPRNVRFLSERMKQSEKTNLKQSIDIVVNDADGYGDVSHPPFTPLCRNVTGDHVEYNYFTFPDFAGHVLLPSGTFLHRNFLCFIWHPAFEELRQWVVAHKTMPDDMTSHRRLLWKQKNWGGMREEAINSILGYFGSIHPGTVGWCAGTPHMRDNNRGVPYVCHPEKPTLDLIPWLNEGGIGSTQCKTSDLVDTAILEKKRADESDADLGFCGECKFKGMSISCNQRVQYLVSRYGTGSTEAKKAIMKDGESCRNKR